MDSLKTTVCPEHGEYDYDVEFDEAGKKIRVYVKCDECNNENPGEIDEYCAEIDFDKFLDQSIYK